MFKAIFPLCLLRGSPANINVAIPTITALAIFLVVLAWFGGGGIGTVGGSDLSPEEHSALQRVITVIPLLQHAFATLMIFTVLNIRRFNSRFAQTITAYLGIQVLFQTSNVCIGFLSSFFPSGLAVVFGGVQLALQVWFFGVMGYICRHAFGIKMFQGVLASIVIILLSYFLAGIATGLFFPEAMKILVELGQTELVPIESN